jgi:drug/metabolite transporter (DMT)-like permease
MLLGCIAFTFMGKFTEALGTACSWQIIALVRAGLAFLFAAALARAAGAPLVFWRPRILWVRSIAGSCSLICNFYAMTHMPLPEVLALANTFPIWIALLSWPLLSERPTPSVWLSVIGGVAGVWLIERTWFIEGSWTALVALAASVFTAVAMMGLNQLRNVDPRAIVVHFSAVAFLFCVVSLFVFDTTPAKGGSFHGGTVLGLLLAIGVTATIGQLFLTMAFSTGVAAKVSVVGLTQVVFALFLDGRVWAGSFELTTLLGIVLVTLPTAWLMLSKGRRPRKTIEAVATPGTNGVAMASTHLPQSDHVIGGR